MGQLEDLHRSQDQHNVLGGGRVSGEHVVSLNGSHPCPHCHRHSGEPLKAGVRQRRAHGGESYPLA